MLCHRCINAFSHIRPDSVRCVFGQFLRVNKCKFFVKGIPAIVGIRVVKRKIPTGTLVLDVEGNRALCFNKDDERQNLSTLLTLLARNENQAIRTGRLIWMEVV